MFTSARLKLTLWYLLIVMTISICFSLAIYFIISHEIDNNYQRILHRYEIQSDFLPEGNLAFPPPIPPIDQGFIDASKERVGITLIFTDLFILIFSASAGYFLAGRTLKPIKDSLDEQNRFVADASHELRTPLTALRTSIEVNLRDKEMTRDQATDVLKGNLKDVEDLQVLSDNLLLLATDEQKDQLSKKQNNLNQLIKNVVSRLNLQAAQKNITINQNVKEVSFLADEEKLTRLLVTLVDNAIKYSHKDGKIMVTGTMLDHHIKIEVKDEGIGITEADLPHIFDRFYRADKSRSESDGYGLGLAIAKKIVESHRGTISVKSEPGQGSTFTVLLPLLNVSNKVT